MSKVFWFDVETTGTDPKENGIIQLACMVELEGSVVMKQEFKMNPLPWRPVISPGAIATHGIGVKEIETYPPADGVKLKIEGFLAGFVDRYDKNDKFIAAGYNVDFDMSFLRELWDVCADPYFGSWFHFSYIDPARIIPFLIYKGRMAALPDMKLGTIARHFGIQGEQAHDAMSDIKVTREIVGKLWELFEKGAG